MLHRWAYVLSLSCIGMFVGAARAQQAPGAESATPPPLGVDQFYFDLTKSEDRVLRTMADRYVNLVKIQEWGDLSGKFKAIAHYVKHDPQITTVTIRVFKGRGADRVSEDKTVPVDKLSKTCQSRVRQIDLAQKKLKEMAAKSGKDGVPEVPGAAPENLGGPMVDERGAEPGARGPEAGPGSPELQPVPEAVPDPSASEPDPLGFAEVQIIPAGPPIGESPAGETPPAEPTPRGGNR